jgi:hypothetical protein
MVSLPQTRARMSSRETSWPGAAVRRPRILAGCGCRRMRRPLRLIAGLRIKREGAKLT